MNRPYELSDAELDYVSGGHPLLIGPIDIDVGDITVTDTVDINRVDILRITDSEIIKNVGVGVAVAAGILGVAGAGNALQFRDNR
jgi:hypothetical protein